MTAVGFTSGDVRKVSRAGDTMSGTLALLGSADLTVQDDVTVGGTLTTANLGLTGNLTVPGDLDVGGAILGDFSTVSNINVMQLLAIGLSTAIISGGELTPNADPTKIDISAFTGYVVDYNSSAPLTATNPQIIFVSVPNQIGLALTGPPSQIVTWWLADSSGTIIQQPNNPTPTQRRTHLVLGATAQFGGAIFADQTLPVSLSQSTNQMADLMDALGTFSRSGNTLSANGVNLTFNKASGEMFARSFSQVPSHLDPHNAQMPAQAPVSARRATAIATLAPLETILDVANYDPGGAGVVTPVPGGANASTNFRVWAFAVNAVTDQLIVQYDQNSHPSLAAAVAAIGAGTYIRNPTFTGGALLGWISAIRTATDLSNPAQATFTQAAKFATP